MIELPEAFIISKQLSQELVGKIILNVVAAQNPHKLAWYSGDPHSYNNLLSNMRIVGSDSFGGQIELCADSMTLVFSDGVNLQYHLDTDSLPKKHQLLLEFDDHTFLCATISMYGGLMCTPTGKNDNQYYLVAKEKPSPLGANFDRDYFFNLFTSNDYKLSLKAFLATNQRIPGLGNGVLQDILFNAGLHPKKKVMTLGEEEKEHLFFAVINTLFSITEQGSRDTEKDIYGNPGGYQTILSKNTVGKPCNRCGSNLVKEAYLGGSIYYCSGCQQL